MAGDNGLIDEREYKGLFSMTFEELEFFCYMKSDYIISRADYINWDAVSRLAPINSYSWDFIEDYIDELNWKYISKYQYLTMDFVKKFNHKLSLGLLLHNKTFMQNNKKDDVIKVFVWNIEIENLL